MPQLRPNQDRSKNAILMIWILLGLQLLGGLSAYLEYQLLLKFNEEGEVSNAAIVANDLRETVISIAEMIGYVISIVLFIMWFRRAYFNLHKLVGALNHSEGWAAGAWFVPILNLFRPFQIMNELYYRTFFYLHDDEPGLDHTISTRWVGWWWGCWLLTSVFGQFVFRYSRIAESIHQLMITDYLRIISAILEIPLAILAVKVIRDYAALETALPGKLKAAEEAALAAAAAETEPADIPEALPPAENSDQPV